MSLALILLILIDRLTKAISYNYSELSVELLGNYLTFTHALNPAGPLGINLPGGFVFVVTVAVVFALISLAINETDRINRVLFLTVLAGVISNSLDRLTYNFVIDVFRLHPGLIFNIADVMIVGGVIVLFIRKLYGERSR